MNGPTLGFGGQLLFLEYLFLATTTATATIFLIAIRAVVVIVIRSIFVTLWETCLGGVSKEVEREKNTRSHHLAKSECINKT
jgi:hypothetical protein